MLRHSHNTKPPNLEQTHGDPTAFTQSWRRGGQKSHFRLGTGPTLDYNDTGLGNIDLPVRCPIFSLADTNLHRRQKRRHWRPWDGPLPSLTKNHFLALLLSY